jgi:hypothetical protein
MIVRLTCALCASLSTGIASSPTQPGYLEFTVQKARVVTQALDDMEAGPHIIISLEMRMKCVVGKCGRCNVGEKYVCKDGPIFSLAELDKLTK